MKRKIIAAFIVLTFAALANGFQIAEWVKYASVEGRYSVLVPTRPKLDTQEAAAKTGDKFIQYMAQANDANSIYMVGYFDILPNMIYSLDEGRNGLLNAIKGTLLKEENISLGEIPGREVKVSAKNGDLELLFRVRYYVLEKRVYVLQHVFERSSESPALAKKTARFFDSFRVTTPR